MAGLKGQRHRARERAGWLVGLAEEVNSSLCGRVFSGGHAKCLPAAFHLCASAVEFTVTDPRPAVCCVLTLAACLKGSIKNETSLQCTPCARGSYAVAGDAVCTDCNPGFTTLRQFSYNESQCSCEWLRRALHTQLTPCCSVTAVGALPCMGHQPASLVTPD